MSEGRVHLDVASFFTDGTPSTITTTSDPILIECITNAQQAYFDAAAERDRGWRPISEFKCPALPSIKAIHAVLKKNRWIKTRKPSLRRFEVWAADMVRCLRQLDIPFDPITKDEDADAIAAYQLEIESRTEQERRKKLGG